MTQHCFSSHQRGFALPKPPLVMLSGSSRVVDALRNGLQPLQKKSCKHTEGMALYATPSCPSPAFCPPPIFFAVFSSGMQMKRTKAICFILVFRHYCTCIQSALFFLLRLSRNLAWILFSENPAVLASTGNIPAISCPTIQNKQNLSSLMAEALLSYSRKLLDHSSKTPSESFSKERQHAHSSVCAHSLKSVGLASPPLDLRSVQGQFAARGRLPSLRHPQ